MGEQRLLVVGVGSELGSLSTALLEQDADFTSIVGIDVQPPRRRLRRCEFVRIDEDDELSFRRRVLEHRPDVIVHLGVWEPHARLGTNDARRATLGYARALCGVLPNLHDLRRLVVRSGIEVYGAPIKATPDETTPLAPTSTYGRMLSDLEAAVGSAAPTTTTITTLRFAPVIGAHVPSPLGRLLRLPVVPIDPLSRARFQVLADDDAARAVRYAAHHGVHGAVNVASPDAVTVMSAVRQGRRLMAPVAPFSWRLADSLAQLVGAPLPDHVRELLRHGRTATTRVNDIGYHPSHSTSDVLARLYSWPSVVRIGPRHAAERVA